MKGNGIGPLVSAFVHERNAVRRLGETPDGASLRQPVPDQTQFSADALQRFADWKARHGGAETEPVVSQAVPAAPAPVEPA
jgi:hypothetical protein